MQEFRFEQSADFVIKGYVAGAKSLVENICKYKSRLSRIIEKRLWPGVVTVGDRF